VEYLNTIICVNPYHALSAAVDSCDIEIVKMLLNAGYEVDLRNQRNETTLFSLILQLKPLPDGPVNFTAEDLDAYDRMRHPGYVHTASPFRRDQIKADLKILIEGEVLIKVKHELQRERMSGVADELISLLLDFGADIHAVHKGGYTPLLAAQEFGMDQIHNMMFNHSKKRHRFRRSGAWLKTKRLAQTRHTTRENLCRNKFAWWKAAMLLQRVPKVLVCQLPSDVLLSYGRWISLVNG